MLRKERSVTVPGVPHTPKAPCWRRRYRPDLFQNCVENGKAAWEAVKPFREVDLPKVRFLTPPEVASVTISSPTRIALHT